MTNPYLIGIASLAVGAAIGVAGMMSWDRPANYDECVVAGMRGQDRAVFPVAVKMCERRFKVEVPMPPTTKFEWYDAKISVSVVPSHNAEMELVRATVSFSTKDCASSSAADFTHVFENQPATNVGSIMILWPNDPRPKCMKTSDAYGRYR